MGKVKASCCWEIYYMLQILIIYVLHNAEYISGKQIFLPKEEDTWHYFEYL